MKPMLKKTTTITVDALRKNRSLMPDLTGDLSGLTGNIHPGLTGNITGLTGKVHPDLTGNISGLWGDLTDLTGDLDTCEITEADRAAGINIADLIG